MLGLLLTFASLPASLSDDILVTPNGNLLQQAKDYFAGHPPAQNQVFHPFKQLTTGSTPSGWMQLGTPPKWLKVIFDTGSDKLVAKTWETISQELAQVDQGIEGMVMPASVLYSHNQSSTYHHLFGKDPLTGEEGPLMSMIAYGSGDAVTEEGTETVVVGTRETKNFSLSEIAQDNLQLLHTSKGISGILGLQHMKNKSMGESIFSKMRDARMMQAFGYCRGANNTGTFIWGDDSTEGDKIPVIGQMHWAVTLQEVNVQEDADSKSSLFEQPHGRRVAPRTHMHHRGSAHSHSHAHKQVIYGRDSGWQKIAWPFAGPDSVDGAGGAPRDIGGGGWPGDDRSGMGGDGTGGSPRDGGDDGSGREASGGDAAAWGPLGGGHDQGDFGVDSDSAGDLGRAQHAIEVSAKHMCTEWNCTAILDTGSNIIAGPTKAIEGITAKINVNNDCSNFDKLPPITLKLGGKPVTIHASSYVMKVELPPGMNLGGDGDGDGDGFGDGGGDGDSFGDGDGDGGDGEAAQGGDGGDQDSDDTGGGSGGCGGGGCDGGGAGEMGDQMGGEMGGYGIGNNERVGIKVPHAPAPASPHSVHIGIPGVGGRPGINIRINRHDPEKHIPENNRRGEPSSLVEKVVKKTARQGSTTARWRAALMHLKRIRGIDLSTALRDLLTYANGTEAQYLCMPALVPIDKHTPFGPLWIVGTPFLDEYYGRYSFDYDADSPTFSFVSLNDSKTCQNLQHNQSNPLDNSTTQLEHKKDATSSGSVTSRHRMMRAEQSTVSKPERHQHQAPANQKSDHHQQQAASTSIHRNGPVIRKLDEIVYPHWAKSLLKI